MSDDDGDDDYDDEEVICEESNYESLCAFRDSSATTPVAFQVFILATDLIMTCFVIFDAYLSAFLTQETGLTDLGRISPKVAHGSPYISVLHQGG